MLCITATNWKGKDPLQRLERGSLEGKDVKGRPTVAKTSNATRWTEKGRRLLVLYTVPRDRKQEALKKKCWAHASNTRTTATRRNNLINCFVGIPRVFVCWDTYGVEQKQKETESIVEKRWIRKQASKATRKTQVPCLRNVLQVSTRRKKQNNDEFC